MPIEEREWRRLVANARLRLTAEEDARFRRDLDAILEAFRILDGAPAADRSAFHPVELPPSLREDEPELWPDAEELTKDRPRHGRFLKGPRV